MIDHFVIEPSNYDELTYYQRENEKLRAENERLIKQMDNLIMELADATGQTKEAIIKDFDL